MNLNDLRYVVALAETTSFRRAAERCFVSQPTLSTQIAKLERELGVVLFERTARGVITTPAGEAVLAHARVVVGEAAEIPRAAKRAVDPESGPLRLGVFPTLGPYLLPHVVPALHDCFPRVELLLTEDKTDALLAALTTGRLDAAILAGPAGQPGMVEQVLFDEPFVLAVPAGHSLAAHDAVSLEMIADEQLLLLEEGHCLRDQALSVCALTGASAREDFYATSLETLRHMVAAGVGVTLLPALSVIPPVPDNVDIVLVPFSDPSPKRTITMCWRDTSPTATLIVTVADEITAYMSSGSMSSGFMPAGYLDAQAKNMAIPPDDTTR